MISISEKKRNQAMEGKGVEMEPLNKKGLLIHAFFSLKITKKSLSAILSSCCNFLYAQSWENMSLLMNTNILCELNMKSMLNQHKKPNYGDFFTTNNFP